MKEKQTKKEIGYALRFPNARFKRDVEKLAAEQKRSLNNFIITVLENVVQNSNTSRVVEKTDNL